MLTGYSEHDEFVDSNGDLSSDMLVEGRPKRNHNTRRAIKDTRTSEKALQGMGNSASNTTTEIDHSACIDINSNNNKPTKQRSEKGKTRNQIQLGDYCLPPDKKEETLGGIASSRTAEYADPYETKQIVEALRAKGTRFSSPVEDHDIFTYDLAKPVDDKDTSSQSHKASFRHTYTEGSKHLNSTTGTSVDTGLGDHGDYDHTITWLTNNKNKMAQVIQNPATINTERHKLPEPKGPQFSGQNLNSGPPTSDQIYAGPYEEPWDSSGSKQKFENIMNKAKTEYRKKSHSDDYEEPVSQAATYEDAWDLKFKEKDLENQMQEAHRRMSEGQSNLKKHRENYDYVEPGTKPKITEQTSPLKQTIKGKPVNLPVINSDAYEDPWDIKEKERQEALEKQFSHAIHSPKSPKDDVPNFPAPPPPKVQTFEEPFDRNQGSQQFSSRSPHNSGQSPNQRRQSDALRPNRGDIAEPINPDIPLDIQKFYHGKISRKYAEDLLLIHKEGSYLVRRSETQDNVFSLSLKGVGGMPMHLRISLMSGMYILGENSKPFPTVPEMIDHYTRNELPVLKADRIKLLHPIPRS